MSGTTALSPFCLFLHGFLGKKEDWDPIIARLPQCNCRAVDLSWHGAATGLLPPGPLFDWLCDEIIRQCPEGPIRLIGYSLGGRIALHLAHRYPDRISHLALLSCNPGVEDRAARWQKDRIWAMRLQTESFEDWLSSWLEQPIFCTLRDKEKPKRSGHPSAFAEMLLRLSVAKQPSMWETLRSWKKPLWLGYGEEDTPYKKLYQNFPQSIAFPHCSHAVLFEAPDLLSQQLRAFLVQQAL